MRPSVFPGKLRGALQFHKQTSVGYSQYNTILFSTLVCFRSMIRWFDEPRNYSETSLSASTKRPSTSTSIMESISSVTSQWGCPSPQICSSV